MRDARENGRSAAAGKLSALVMVGVPVTVALAGGSMWPNDMAAATARARFEDARGARKGDASLLDTPNGVLLKVDLARIPQGIHAFHIHEVGACDPPEFTSAGAHFAPQGREHGVLDARGAHAGDLPNIHVPPSGEVAFELFLKELALSSGPNTIFDEDGAALVVHAGGDDYRTDPAGSAGRRIACAVIVR